MSQKHIVTCQTCGQQFDSFRGGYYHYDTGSYTCRRCGRSADRALRGVRSGMRQTVVGMVLKILLGMLFLSVSVDTTGDWDLGYFLTCVVIGCSLFAWALIPWLKARQEQKELFLMDDRNNNVGAPQKKAQKNTDGEYPPVICPGCGATGTGKVCEYCGTSLR